jgi:hypothetical protein
MALRFRERLSMGKMLVVGILRPILLQWYADLTKVIFNGALLRRTTHGSPFCKDEGSEAANEPCAGLAPLMFTHMVDADVHVPIEKRSSSGLNAEQPSPSSSAATIGFHGILRNPVTNRNLTMGTRKTK